MTDVNQFTYDSILSIASEPEECIRLSVDRHNNMYINIASLEAVDGYGASFNIVQSCLITNKSGIIRLIDELTNCLIEMRKNERV
jgi:hypothetical protein